MTDEDEDPTPLGEPSPTGALEGYEILTVLPHRPGDGPMTAFRAKNTETDETVMLKCINAQHLSPDSVEVLDMQQEQRLPQHESVASLKGSRLWEGYHPDVPYRSLFLLEYEDVPASTVGALLKSSVEPLPLTSVELLLAMIADGLSHLHSLDPPIWHRNLHVDAIAIPAPWPRSSGSEEPPLVKLIDWGVPLEQLRAACTGQAVIPVMVPYISPARLRDQPHGADDDVWALGLIGLQLLKGRASARQLFPSAPRRPWGGGLFPVAGWWEEDEWKRQLEASLADHHETLEGSRLLEALRGCLVHDKTERWTAEQVQRHLSLGMARSSPEEQQDSDNDGEVAHLRTMLAERVGEMDLLRQLREDDVRAMDRLQTRLDIATSAQQDLRDRVRELEQELREKESQLRDAQQALEQERISSQSAAAAAAAAAAPAAPAAPVPAPAPAPAPVPAPAGAVAGAGAGAGSGGGNVENASGVATEPAAPRGPTRCLPEPIPIASQTLVGLVRDIRLNRVARAERYSTAFRWQDACGWTPLHVAMVHGNEAIVRIAQDRGAHDAEALDGLRASELRPILWRRVFGGISPTASSPSSTSPTILSSSYSPQEAMRSLVQAIGNGGKTTSALCEQLLQAKERHGEGIFANDRQFGIAETRIASTPSRALPVLVGRGPGLAIGPNGEAALKTTITGRAPTAVVQCRESLTPDHPYFCVVMNVHARQDAITAVGLAPEAKLDRYSHLLGWESGTVGYHSDDGKLFVESGTGRRFGSPFTHPGAEVGVQGLFREDDGRLIGVRFYLDGNPASSSSARAGPNGVVHFSPSASIGTRPTISLAGAGDVVTIRGPSAVPARLTIPARLHQTEDDHTMRDARPPSMGILFAAARCGRSSVVRLCVELGVEVDVQDARGATPLAWAAQYGHQQTLAVLLELGALVDTVDQDGWNPLHYAVSTGRSATALRLLEECPSLLNGQDADGKTPLQTATEKDYAEMADTLRQRGGRSLAGGSASTQDRGAPLDFLRDLLAGEMPRGVSNANVTLADLVRLLERM